MLGLERVRGVKIRRVQEGNKCERNMRSAKRTRGKDRGKNTTTRMEAHGIGRINELK